MFRLPSVFANRDFRLFWIGSAASSIGSQCTTVAMAWQMYELTNSAVQIGFLGLARAIPQIALTLVGGLVADLWDRKRLLVVLQLMQWSISASLAGMTFSGHISPEALYVAALLLAFCGALEAPPRQAVVPNLVDASELQNAVALNMTQRQVASILGPSLAGLILAVAGPLWCYVIDAASWLAMVGGLLFIARPLQQGRQHGGLTAEAFLAGARFVRSQPVLLSFMALDFGATFFGSPAALMPVFARDLLHVGPEGLGILYAAPSVGGLLAALIVGRTKRLYHTGLWVLVNVAFYGACIAAFALSPVFWLSVLLLAGSGFGNSVGAVLRGTSNQLLTPDHLRGRVAAVNNAFVVGGPYLGQFESGVVAGLWEPMISALSGGLGAMFVVGAIALVPAVRRFTLTEKTSAASVANGAR